eukprot:79297_1
MSSQQSHSAASEKEKGKSDDKCIGNRKIRTIILCLLLLIFSIFAAGYLFLIVERAKDANVTTGCATCEEAAKSRVHGANVIISGLIFTMLFAIVAMFMVCIPACDPNKFKVGRIPGLFLIFSGGFYIFGWFWYINADKEIDYNFLSDSEKEDRDAIYLGWFGEGLLYGATTILLGLDLLIPHKYLLEDEFKRLFCNLGILCIVSILTMPAYFILSGVEDGVEAIGTGYIIIFVSTLCYIIIYLMSCCKSLNCKDKCIVRVILAIATVIGGLITAIGYYVFAGGHSTLGDEGDDAKRVAYYIGYTVLVAGLCCTWALDMAWDDIRDD